MSATITDTQGIIAIAGAAVAVVALAGCGALYVSLRRLRVAQRVVLGDGSPRDLIAHASALELSFDQLRTDLGELVDQIDARLDVVEGGLRKAIAYRALLRYDAYNEMSGRQSVSIALLDEDHSGIVVSSIHHRDQARMYAKQVHAGRAELALSPEEEEAIRLALAGEVQSLQGQSDGGRRRG